MRSEGDVKDDNAQYRPVQIRDSQDRFTRSIVALVPQHAGCSISLIYQNLTMENRHSIIAFANGGNTGQIVHVLRAGRPALDLAVLIKIIDQR